MSELNGSYVRLSEDFVKIIISYLERGEEPYCRDICNRCIGHCTCEYKDKLARQALIESFIPLAKLTLKKYGFRKPWYMAELLSEAMLALAKSVDMLDSTILEPAAYVRFYISKQVLRFAICDSTIKVPLESTETHGYLRKCYLQSTIGNDLFDEYTCYDPHVDDALGLDEVIRETIVRERDRGILDLILEGGWTHSEIADTFDLTRARISQLSYEIQQKLVEAINDK